MAIALRWLATGDTFESIGGMCGASRTSVHRAVIGFCHALSKHAGRFIYPPRTTQEAKAVAAEFESFGNWSSRQRGGVCTPGIPQIVGAIDGTQVLLAKKPCNSGDAYINRKGYPAMNVGAVVDSRGRFMDVCVGHAGKCHDARMLESSTMWHHVAAA